MRKTRIIHEKIYITLFIVKLVIIGAIILGISFEMFSISVDIDAIFATIAEII